MPFRNAEHCRFKVLPPAAVLSLIALAACFPGPLEAAIPPNERDALEKLYESTGGQNWTRNNGWLGPSGSECSGPGWSGVVCNSDESHVIGLELSANNLAGTLPVQIGALTDLVTLNIASNRVSGTLPEELGETNLVVLLASENQLEGPLPQSLSALPTLEILDCRFNLLSGELPTGMTRLPRLRELLLEANRFSGPLPIDYGQNSPLEILNLALNDFTGTIPSSLGSILGLRELLLNRNQLNGPIPPELGSLTNLRRLVLGANELTGRLPEALTNLSNLTLLSAGQCQLTGPLPEDIGNLAQLRELSLGTNSLDGPLPSSLASLSTLEFLYLDNNSFDGEIPPQVFTLPLLKELRLNRNDLTGALPREWNAPSLTLLDLSTNSLDGTIPDGLAAVSRLRELRLAGNRFRGMVPESLRQFESLTVLDLRWNALTVHESTLRSFLNAHSPDGDVLATQTLPVTPLSAIPLFPNVFFRSLLLSWSASTYLGNEGGYQLRIEDVAFGVPIAQFTVSSKATTSTLFRLLVLFPGGTYRFSVRAFTSPHSSNRNQVISASSSPLIFTIADAQLSAGSISLVYATLDVAEGEQAVMPVARLEGVRGRVSARAVFTLESAGARDFASIDDSVQWPDGDSGLRFFRFSITADNKKEPPETFQLSLGSISGNAGVGQVRASTIKILNGDVSGSGSDPVAAHDPAGNQLFVWAAPEADGSGGIFGRFADAVGRPVGDAFQISEPLPQLDEQNPSAVSVKPDHFEVAWQDQRGAVRRCVVRTRGGIDLGKLVFVAAKVSQGSLSIAGDAGAGRFALVWKSGARLLAQVVSDGETLDSIFRVDGNSQGTPSEPSMAFNSRSDNLLFVWMQQRSGDLDDLDILGRSFSSNGMPAGPEFFIPIKRARVQSQPRVVGSEAGFLVVWLTAPIDQSTGDPSGTEVRARAITEAGLGEEFRVNQSTTGSQSGVTVTLDADDNCAIAWLRDGSNANGLYVRFLDKCGSNGAAEKRVAIGRSVRRPSLFPTDQSVGVVFEVDDIANSNGGIGVKSVAVERSEPQVGANEWRD